MLSNCSHLRGLDLDVAACCQGAGQLAGGAGSPHLVDGHVGSSLPLLGHHLHTEVFMVLSTILNRKDLFLRNPRVKENSRTVTPTWMVCCPPVLPAVPVTGMTLAGRVLPLGLTERICWPCCDRRYTQLTLHSCLTWPVMVPMTCPCPPASPAPFTICWSCWTVTAAGSPLLPGTISCVGWPGLPVVAKATR